MFLGKYRLGETLIIPLVAQGSTGSAVDAAAPPEFRIYRGSVAAGDPDTPVMTGTFALRDSVGTTGWYTATIVLSTANGFTSEETYTIFTTGTVDGQTPATQYIFHIGVASEFVHAPSSSTSYLSVEEARDYLTEGSGLNDDQILAILSRAQETIRKITGQHFFPITETRIFSGMGRPVLTIRRPILELLGLIFLGCNNEENVIDITGIRITPSRTMLGMGNVVPLPFRGSRSRWFTDDFSGNGCGVFPMGLSNVKVEARWGRYETPPEEIKHALGLLLQHAARCDDPGGAHTHPFSAEATQGDLSYTMRKIWNNVAEDGMTGFAEVDSILTRYKGAPVVVGVV
jgi:hypothetical protein